MSVSRDDVVWCYRNLLGREPESEESVEAHLDQNDFRHLVLTVVGSREFLAKRLGVHSTGSDGNLGLPVVLDKLDIDIDATPHELAKCATKIKTVWEHLGDEKAHWSVLSTDAFLPHNLNDSIDSFWASGELDVTEAMRALRQFGLDGLEEKVCVEYGCGVGRITVSLSNRFKFVHAYDISRNHLEHARARTREVGAANIAFYECANDFRAGIAPCDFFYSILVLQHNPPPVILALIRTALTQLNAGGIAMFQVPTYIVGYRFRLSEWLAMDHALDMQMHCVPQDAVTDLISACGCRLLSVREDACSNAKNGMVSNTFFCRK